MKRKYIFVAVLLAVILFSGVGLTRLYVTTEDAPTEDTLTVVTSFYPMYIAAMNIIGDNTAVHLENLSEPQTGCLHDYQLTPADMKLLSAADVFIVNGGGIESFLSDVAASYPKLTIINASADVALLESSAEHDHDHGTDTDVQDEIEEEHDHETETEHLHDEAEEEHDHETETEHLHDETAEAILHNHEEVETDEHDHGTENAHAWMSIDGYMTQIQTIADSLAAKDTANASVYQANAAAYLDKLQPLEEEIHELSAQTQGMEVIIFHEAYAYVANELGMEVVYSMDLDEERQVSAGEVADVVNEIGLHGITVVLAEELYGKDMGDTIERETAATTYYLDTMVRGEYDADSYLNAMENNLKILKEALAQ